VTGAVAWLAVALGVGVVLVRRRSVAIALVTSQTLLLALGASRLGEGVALAARGIALGVLLALLVRRTREQRPVSASSAPLVRGTVALTLALALAALVPRVGLVSAPSQRAALALVSFGLVACAMRRATLFQVAGLVLVENGVAIAALSVPGAGNVIVELGAALDLMLIAVVASAFHGRIFATFGAGDSRHLRSLRD
jgi:hydrogenase-4 membrane subunit HyfE